MERKLALWIGVPFLGVAWTLIAVVAFVPGIAFGRIVLALLLVLAGAGTILLLFRMLVRDRVNSPLPDTLYPIAGILVALGVVFHEEVGAIARGIVDHVMPGGEVSEGTRIARAADGQFHVILTVEGGAVDFLVNLEAPFNLLTPDVPKQIGINPSTLIYDERIDLAAGGNEYAAEVVLPKARLGSAVIKDLPFKVLATGRLGNVLGKAFFQRVKGWRIEDDTLIVVQ